MKKIILISFLACLSGGDTAWIKAVELKRQSILVNLFGDFSPFQVFQIDGNFGFIAGIAEMLIQNHQENTTALLYIIKGTWDKGEVMGLKIRGNINVGMKWEKCRLTAAMLVAAEDCTMHMKYNDKSKKYHVLRSNKIKRCA